MKDLIVVSFITERRHMIDEYEDQLDAAGIDHHIETVDLSQGISSITARWRFGFNRAMCQRFSEYSRIVFTDAWDVLFYGSKSTLFIPEEPMVSAERNCWPEPHLAAYIHSDSPWRYVNAGMFCGAPDRVVRWIDAAMQTPDLDEMDQVWFNRRLAAQDFPIHLDWGTSLFYTVSADKEDGMLVQTNDGPWNSRYGTFPHWFHFAGPCSSVPFRQLLRGARRSL